MSKSRKKPLRRRTDYMIRFVSAGWTSDRLLLLSVTHLHQDLLKMSDRRESFKNAPTQVKVAVIARLDQRIAVNQVGNFTAGMSALLSGAVGILAAIAAISLAGYNDFISAVVHLTNSTTGVVTGLSGTDVTHTISSLVAPIGLTLLIVVSSLSINLAIAHWRDGRRALAVAWRNVYESL